jgi:hypothetical protein
MEIRCLGLDRNEDVRGDMIRSDILSADEEDELNVFAYVAIFRSKRLVT